jgi:SOS-response transcriptional repressor LexA
VATAIKAVLAEESPQRGAIQRVAREIGTSVDILSNLANGRTSATTHPEVVEALRKRYKRPQSWPFSEVSDPKVPIPAGDVSLPFVGQISAGEKVDWTDPYESDDYEFVPSAMSAKGRFCCTIDGDSMYDLLHPGDLCVFQSHMVPRLHLIVLYRHADNTATIKQLKHDGERFFLHPLNPAYSDTPADGTCMGYLVGIVRRWGSREITVYDPNGIHPD